MVSRPDRCCSDNSTDNRQNCGAHNPGRDSESNWDSNPLFDSENRGQSNLEDNLRGNTEHNSEGYPGDDGEDFRESDSTVTESGS